MFASGVGRIFKEFDEFLDLTYNKRAQQNAMEAALWKKKNRKKLTNLLENFLEETACLLSIDRSDFGEGNLPWGLIFYNRMLSTRDLISVSRHALYSEAFNDYADYYKEAKPKEIKKKRQFVNSVNTLVLYLKTHKVDPDNVLVGLRPSSSIMERYEEWLRDPTDHKIAAKKLSEKEGNGDPLSLYFVGYPAKKGDIVISQIPVTDAPKDLRLTASREQTITVYARIKEAVEFNKKTFLTIWIAPKEEEEITVLADPCVPIKNIVAGTSWIGEVKPMRDMVVDPRQEFLEYMAFEFAERLDNMFPNYQLKKVYIGIQTMPVSFFYYHSLKKIVPIIDSLHEKKSGNGIPKMKTLRKKFLSEAVTAAKEEQDKLIADINDPDGSRNKLFMATSESDIARVTNLKPEEVVNNFIDKFHSLVHQTITHLESEKREVMKGTLKNQLSKWWCLLIKTRTDILLTEVGYDESAWNEDTYIDEAPKNLAGVKENLIIVQKLLNPKDKLHNAVTKATEDIKNEVYPVIDDFIMKAHIVLSEDLLDEKIGVEYKSSSFNLENVKKVFNEKKDELLSQENGQDKFNQLDGLMKDLKYLVEMKNLEYKTEEDRKAEVGGKLELSYAVPLSGLVMGSFFRLENILKTVLELWAPKDMSIPSIPKEVKPPIPVEDIPIIDKSIPEKVNLSINSTPDIPKPAKLDGKQVTISDIKDLKNEEKRDIDDNDEITETPKKRRTRRKTKVQNDDDFVNFKRRKPKREKSSNTIGSLVSPREGKESKSPRRPRSTKEKRIKSPRTEPGKTMEIDEENPKRRKRKGTGYKSTNIRKSL